MIYSGKGIFVSIHKIMIDGQLCLTVCVHCKRIAHIDGKIQKDSSSLATELHIFSIKPFMC